MLDPLWQNFVDPRMRSDFKEHGLWSGSQRYAIKRYIKIWVKCKIHQTPLKLVLQMRVAKSIRLKLVNKSICNNTSWRHLVEEGQFHLYKTG